MAKLHNLFVYGTLRIDHEKAPFVLRGYQMYEYPGNFTFPYIKNTGNFRDRVFGEVIQVTIAQLSELDAYEGVDRDLYSRDLVTVSDTDGNDIAAFAYVEKTIAHKHVKSGNWFSR